MLDLVNALQHEYLSMQDHLHEGLLLCKILYSRARYHLGSVADPLFNVHFGNINLTIKVTGNVSSVFPSQLNGHRKPFTLEELRK